nr:hypothetical protein [uncultured bacterium]
MSLNADPTAAPTRSNAVPEVAAPLDSTDHPIPLWPEGVVAVVAGIALVVIALRHHTWIQRKAGEAQRAVEEFQKQGGLDDLTHMARQASQLLKGNEG